MMLRDEHRELIGAPITFGTALTSLYDEPSGIETHLGRKAILGERGRAFRGVHQFSRKANQGC